MEDFRWGFTKEKSYGENFSVGKNGRISQVFTGLFSILWVLTKYTSVGLVKCIPSYQLINKYFFFLSFLLFSNFSSYSTASFQFVTNISSQEPQQLISGKRTDGNTISSIFKLLTNYDLDANIIFLVMFLSDCNPNLVKKYKINTFEPRIILQIRIFEDLYTVEGDRILEMLCTIFC